MTIQLKPELEALICQNVLRGPYRILGNLAPHVRLAAVLAMNTGLRISEILGMQWTGVNFGERTLTISRSIVGRHEGETKTMASAGVLPLHEMLVQELRAWRGANGCRSRCAPIAPSKFLIGCLDWLLRPQSHLRVEM